MIGLAARLLAPAAAAQAPGATRPGWSFDLTSYGWLTATSGTVGAGAVRVGVDNSFVDTLRQADGALSFMGRGELRAGRLGLFLDGIYTQLGYDDVRAGPLTLDATSVLGVLEFGAAYEVADDTWRVDGPDGWALDVLAGGRWTHLKT